MSKYFFRATVLCLFLLCGFSFSVNAQNKKIAKNTLSVSKKATVIVVGNAAKFSFNATKFTAKKVAKPLIVKATPKVAKLLLGNTKTIVKKGFPVAKSAFIKYIKYRFSP